MRQAGSATHGPPTRSVSMGEQASQSRIPSKPGRERDDTPVTLWLQRALAGKYDQVLAEPLPPSLARLLETSAG